MALIYPNLTPGSQASRESVENKLFWGPMNNVVFTSVVLSSATVDARSTPTTDLRAGLVLGKVTSSGEYVNYSATATDGSQIAQCILAQPVQMLDSGGTARDQLVVVAVAGAVKTGECGGLDDFAKAHLFGRFVWDTDNLGNQSGWRDVVAKTADYTVLSTDNNTIFTNAGASGAVIFTLPTIAKGLRYRFYVEADQNVTITAAAVDTLVTHNDAAADSIALSTASRKLGGCLEVFANAAATKWLVFPFVWNIADDGSTTTKFTIST